MDALIRRLEYRLRPRLPRETCKQHWGENAIRLNVDDRPEKLPRRVRLRALPERVQYVLSNGFERSARLRALWTYLVRGYRYEICERCGRPVGLVWHADDELWATVSGHDDGSGILCPACFDAAAERLGRFVRWEARPQ
jgi:hypothetical protein